MLIKQALTVLNDTSSFPGKSAIGKIWPFLEKRYFCSIQQVWFGIVALSCIIETEVVWSARLIFTKGGNT